MIRISELRLPAGSPAERREKLLGEKIRKMLRLREAPTGIRILRHSVDARKKPEIFDVYTVCFAAGTEAEEAAILARAASGRVTRHEEVTYAFPGTPADAPRLAHRPVVVGAGPAGLFAALLLAEHGYRPLVLERGGAMEERIRSVRHFWETGRLDPSSNIQFGEGGAGTFSDGKLTSGITDRFGRKELVNRVFIEAGAPEEIAVEQYPHIGTDLLRGVIVRMRGRITALGGEFRFRTLMEELLLEKGRVAGVRVRRTGEAGTAGDAGASGADHLSEVIPTELVILAPGHSARDTIRMLGRLGVPLSPKRFAVGYRVMHPQRLIDGRMYGPLTDREKRRLGLPPASYRLAAETAEGRGVYSFCMCPGGYVVNASSEEGRLAVNGMSDYARDTDWANSAIVMAVGPRDYGSEDVLAGMRFQERLEERAFEMAGGRIPMVPYVRFREEMRARLGEDASPCGEGRPAQPGEDASPCGEEATEASFGDPAGGPGDALRADPRSCVMGEAAEAPLWELLPDALGGAFVFGMERFDRVIPGFAGKDAYVLGLESRTSSPVRIERGEDLFSSVPGLIPCGEGAGYAGGIMSAAVDGIRAAEAAARSFAPPEK